MWASQVALAVKNPPADAGDTETGSIQGREDLLESEMVTRSSILLAWEISRTEEPGRLQCMGVQREGHS